jgi:hypothetical protein
MSLEASVYTADVTPISRDDLVRVAAESGWVFQPVQDIVEPARFRTISGGVLTDGDYFRGWRTGDRHAGEYERALAAQQVEQLEAWAQEDPERELGAAFIHTQSCRHEYSADQEAQLAAETCPQYVATLRSAKLEYLVDLHANNDDFRLGLARLICRSRGGPPRRRVGHRAGRTRCYGGPATRLTVHRARPSPPP